MRSLQRFSRHWTERSQVALRRLQVATSWSAQVLLYPIYALFQATRLVGTQVGNAMTEEPSLESGSEIYEVPLSAAPQAIAVNTPIVHVLQAVQSLSLPVHLPVFLGTPDVRIRGIASQLETRQLVLVTNQNQVLDLLSSEQQYSLNQRIIWEVASYWRTVRLANPAPGGRFLQAIQSGWRRLRPATSGGALVALPPTNVNMPMQRSLQTVKTLLSTADLDALQAQVSSITSAMTLSPTSVYIQGVASQWQTRSLVLVTNRNEVLDVLTADQQTVLHQRIIWEVAHYLRYVQVRLKAEKLSPLRLPGEDSQVLPGVRRLYQLMAWMQMGPVAIATNLFQEASLAKRWGDMGAIAPTSPDASPPRALPQFSSMAQIQQRLTAVLKPVTNSLQHFSPPQSTDKLPQPEPLVPPGQVAVAEEARSPLPAKSRATVGMEVPGTEKSAEHFHIDTDYIDTDYIDTDVQLMGYELSLLERVVRWLDYCLVWCEDAIKWIWKQLPK